LHPGIPIPTSSFPPLLCIKIKHLRGLGRKWGVGEWFVGATACSWLRPKESNSRLTWAAGWPPQQRCLSLSVDGGGERGKKRLFPPKLTPTSSPGPYHRWKLYYLY
jgi:hypothetical protein